MIFVKRLILIVVFACTGCIATAQTALTLQIMNLSSKGEARVQVKNPTNHPVRIWEDSNSWGASRWSLLLMRNGKLETFFQRLDQDFTRNIPTFVEIAPGDEIEQILNLHSAFWTGPRPDLVKFIPGDLVIVVYDVPYFPEMGKRKVWYGVASAMKKVE